MKAQTDVERLRLALKPDTIKVLFVGESAPAGGTFFYKADSNLYRYTREAFSVAFGLTCASGRDFFDLFKAHGFYLDDLCDTPVNDLSKTLRRRT